MYALYNQGAVPIICSNVIDWYTLMKKEKEYTSIRLTKETVKRLQSRGKFNDSYESIIRVLLDKTDSENNR
jgi:hypothetical protein